MATHQSNSAPAHTHLPASRPSKRRPKASSEVAVLPISEVPSVDRLDMPLLNDQFPATDIHCLPFVRDLSAGERAAQMERYGAGRSFWSVPPSSGYTPDCEVGQRFGAAYLIHLSIAQGHALSLASIVSQMSDDEPKGFKVGFLSAVELYARSLAVNVGRERIESEHLERMARGRALLQPPRKSVGRAGGAA